MLKIELIMTGEELLDGRVVNKNERDIAFALNEVGLAIERSTTVGDHPEKLLQVFSEVAKRADIAIITGGLGPTDDDRTAEILALLTQQTIQLHEIALAQVTERFQQMQRPMASNNKKQAMLPEKAILLENKQGTAPGFMVTAQKCDFIALPGVPREMNAMLKTHVVPLLLGKRGEHFSAPLRHSFRCFGAGESHLAELLESLYPLPESVEIGYRAHFPEIHISLKHKGEDSLQKTNAFEALQKDIRARIQKYIFTEKNDSFEEAFAEICRQKQATFAVAESCTGGLIGHMLTSISGISDVFLMSAVTYANSTKENVLGVLPESLRQHGAVSEQVAREMAEGVLKLSGATIAASVTGIAGPNGGSDEKPVGTVHVAVATSEKTSHRKLQLGGGRDRIRTLSAYAVLELTKKALLEQEPQFYGETSPNT